MSKGVNRERINDRYKLAFHRLVARRLKDDAAMLAGARNVVRAWQENAEGKVPPFVGQWTEILSRPTGEIRRLITSRSKGMNHLRSSSPFGMLGPGLLDETARRKLWRIVKRPWIA